MGKLQSPFLFVLLAVVCQARVQPEINQTACNRTAAFAHLEGLCVRGEEQCNGTHFRWGCSGRGCSLCVGNTSICLEKPVCSEANGECVRNLTDCDRLINERHCHGDGCACCKDGCLRQPDCQTAGGYCLSKNQYHKCPGIRLNSGCLGTDCFCCVPDPKICIEKPACTNTNGTCLEKANWTNCTYEVDSSLCMGIDCACCREKKCVRSTECEDQGGYCFRKKKNPSRQHVCHGSEIASGCGGSDCVCCIPDADM